MSEALTYFTGCSHFHHDRISSLTGRPFSSVQDMNDTLICNWNARVKKHDFVYHLGDFIVGRRLDNQMYFDAIFERLNGIITLIRGNHEYIATKYGAGRFYNIKDYLEIEVGGQNFVLSHYPMLSWNRERRGSIHLHSHTHQKNPLTFPGKRIIHVGVDSWNFSPVLSQELVKLANNQQIDYEI